MSIINGLKKMKAWEWILLLFFLAMIFLFRFKYMTEGGIGALLRVNRITGIAKVYEWDYNSGKFKPYEKEDYIYKYKKSGKDIERSRIEKMLLNEEKE